MILLLFSLWTDEITLGANHVSFLPPASSNAVGEDNGNVLITFTTGHTNPYLEIYFAIIDGSGSVLRMVNVSRAGTQSSQWAGYPNAISFDTTYYFIWDDRRISYHEIEFQNEIYYRVFYPDVAGGTWLGIQNATSSDGEWSINPSAAKLGDRIYVAWEDTRDGYDAVYYSYLENGLWSNDFKVSGSIYYAGYPCVVTGNSEVFIFYEEVQDSFTQVRAYSPIRNQYYTISLDGEAYSPSGFASGDEICVVWEQVENGVPRIYSRVFNSTWGEAVKLTTSGYGEMPCVTGKDGIFYYAWVEDGNVVFKSDTSDLRVMNQSSYNCFNPHVYALDNGILFLCWSGYITGDMDAKIFYRVFSSSKSLSESASFVVRGSRLYLPVRKSRDYELYTIDGRRVSTFSGPSFAFNGLPPGIYLLRTRDSGERKIYRVVYLGE